MKFGVNLFPGCEKLARLDFDYCGISVRSQYALEIHILRSNLKILGSSPSTKEQERTK